MEDKTVTFKVIEYDGYKWAILHDRYSDGAVLGMKLPYTGSPATEPDPWMIRRFYPKGEVT